MSLSLNTDLHPAALRAPSPAADRLAAIAAAAVALLALVVMAGWSAQYAPIVQIRPEYAPMQFNTALGLLLGAVALLGVVSRARGAALGCAWLLLALAAAHGFQDLSGISLGIDRLFVEPEITIRTAMPGRPSPLTTLCLGLLALAALAALWGDGPAVAPCIAFAGAALAVAGVALLGYVTAISAAYQWGQFTAMALHTSIGVAALSAGWFAWCWPRGRPAGFAVPGWLALALPAIALALTLALVRALHESDLAQRTLDSRALMERLTGETRLRMELRVRALERMALRLAHSDPPTERAWRHDARDYLNDFPGFVAIAVVRSAGDIARIEARTAEETAAHGAMIERMLARHRPLAAGMGTGRFLAAEDTGRELFALAAVPIDHGGRVLAVLVDLPRLLEAILRPTDRQAHNLEVSVAGRMAFRRAIPELERPGVPARAALGLRGLDLEFSGTPQPAKSLPGPRELSWVILTGGTLASLLLGFLIALTARVQAQRLELARLANDLDARVRERTHALEASNRELEAMTYTIAHELRAPLRHIVGFGTELTQRIGQRLADDERRLLERVLDGGRRQSVLIDELLGYAHLGQRALKLGRLDLAPLVAEIVETARAADARVHWRIGDLPAVRGDATLVRMALANLIDNAVKFSGRAAQPQIEVGSLREPSGAPVVYVRDNGAGFDAQHHEKLFRLFSRLHRAGEYPGAGVGLALVRRAMERLGGAVWAEGAAQRGATFYLRFPVEAAP